MDSEKRKSSTTIDDHVFPLLFEQLNLGDIELKNRIVMGSMHTGLEDADNDSDVGYKKQAAYFAERAKHDVGLIITGGVSPSENSVPMGTQSIPFSTASQIAQHKIITQAVKNAAGDCKICMQLLHAGPLALSLIHI